MTGPAAVVALLGALPAFAQADDGAPPTGTVEEVAVTTPERPPWELRLAVGAEVAQRPFGVVDVGLRRGPWTLEWLTDTLHVRFAPDLPHGRAWVALRGEGGAAGMLLARWADGAPDPGASQLGFYGGIEGGGQAWLPGGVYVGAEGAARYWAFAALPTTTDVLPARPVLTGDAVVGVHRDSPHGQVHAWARGGLDASWVDGGWRLSPHVHGTVTTAFAGTVRPRLEVRAGWATATDAVTATRVGGLNPYVVPLAGAAWAELHAERYLAARGGFEGAGARGPLRWTAGAAVDLVATPGRRDTGFSLQTRLTSGRRFLEAQVGWAPWLPRTAGVPLAAWVRLGMDWGPLAGGRARTPR